MRRPLTQPVVGQTSWLGASTSLDVPPPVEGFNSGHHWLRLHVATPGAFRMARLKTDGGSVTPYPLPSHSLGLEVATCRQPASLRTFGVVG